jgi:transposase
MPCCDALAYRRTSRLGTRHFAHSPGSHCGAEGECAEHLAAKAEIVVVCHELGWDALSEYARDQWRADVYATRGPHRLAFEIQWSSQTLQTTKERQAAYGTDLKCCWLFKQLPSLPPSESGPEVQNTIAERNLPMFRISRADCRFDVTVDHRTVTLREFVQARLQGRIHFCNRRTFIAREVQLVVSKIRCWRRGCRAPYDVFYTREIVRSNCGAQRMSELLASWGHEVILANPRNLRMISDSIRKSDRVDAHTLARLARIDPQLLSPIVHCDRETYSHMTLLKSRDLLVRTRTRLTNAIRGVMKAVGLRLPSAGGTSFPSKTTLLVPEELKPSLLPLLETISHLNKQIYQFDKAIERAAREKYPETGRLRQISGVGPVTSLQYVLTIGDPNRFAHSRDVGPYLGLTPRRRQSGDIDQQLRISKAGNRRLRSLLVQCAQYLLGRFGPDTDLKRWGARMAERGGKNAKKRAIVAIARKLAVLLHRLWVTGDTYHPLHNAIAMFCWSVTL